MIIFTYFSLLCRFFIIRYIGVNMSAIKKIMNIGIIGFILCGIVQAQFFDSFKDNKIEKWDYFTGDGQAEMKFEPKNDFARISIDATKDKHNVWWAIIKRNIAPYLNLRRLQKPGYELRVEAQVRLSHAPRRINFMINTQRTTNFHKQLREYDIADTSNWQVISM